MISIAAAAFSLLVPAFGTPKILKFFGGADAAISLQFDDSMMSQLDNALPLLNARGIRATFFVNTDSYQYKARRLQWEVDVLKAGHELGNHTAHHGGAKNIEELNKEIGDCSDQLMKVYGSKPRLMSFAIPGGVPWNFTSAQLDPILDKYGLILAVNRNFFDEQKTDPVSFVQKAIDTHSASNVSMHGTGGEWLSTSLPNLTRLLDFLVAHRPSLWTAPQIEIYKYIRERDAAKQPVLSDVSDHGFSLAVTCDLPKVYDEPLTVEVAVPTTWNSIQMKQLGAFTTYKVSRGIARFEVVPNAGAAQIRVN